MGVLNYESVSYKKRPIPEENRRRIDQRLEAGLALLRETYRVEACPSDPALSDPVIGGRPHHARRYDIAGVGNLLVMTVKEAEENQLSSFVLMPYAKNLPLFSTDFVYSGEKRFFLLEIYDLSVEHDANFERGIDAFRAFGETLTDLPDFPTRAAWYDDIRPVCNQIRDSPDCLCDRLPLLRESRTQRRVSQGNYHTFFLHLQHLAS